MEDAAHITIILDIATSAWLICFYHKATQKSFKKFYGGYKDLIEKYHRSLKEMVNDSFFISHMAGFYSFFFYIWHSFVTRIWQYLFPIASLTGVKQDADDAYSIRST